MNLKHLRDSCIGTSKHRYTLERVDILSPYLSEQFFDNLSSLKPGSISIATDASCSSELIGKIEKKLAPKLKGIRLAQCAGIVHAKCYLFHWKNKKTNRYKRLFLWGSCNATGGGFSRNAEVYSWINLSKINKDQRSIILNYFSEISCGETSVKSAKVEFDNGLTVKLPSIDFFSSELNTFDLWIQKGRLCHPFPNDPSFRHLKVVLLDKISPKSELSSALESNSISINQQTTVSFDYLRHNEENPDGAITDEDFTANWKSRYFIDTVYGFWTSEDCFKKNNGYFRKNDSHQRNIEIDRITSADYVQRNKWSNEFLSIIESIYKSLPNPERYFHSKDGKLDTNRYEEQFNKQLNRDYIRSKDSWFRRGYISGYDFPEIPPMREHSSHWEELISSFIESLYFEINKSGTRNWLAQTIRDYTDIGKAVDSDTLLMELQDNWKVHKESIECFYCSE